MTEQRNPDERIDTVVIGGGQAGLAVAYHLARREVPFVVLDASARIGDAWRQRWDSLRVFTTARFSGLPGFPFPAPRNSFPTKDQVADYLGEYARRFDLPVRSGTRVERLYRRNGSFRVVASGREIEASNVVVAMSSYQVPRIPEFAKDLDHDIVQMHSVRYRNPSQYREGPVLVVGAADSGTEVAMEASRSRQTWLSGRHPGHIPFRIETWFGRNVGVPTVIGHVFHRVLSAGNPLGRRVRPKLVRHPVGPNVRVKPADIEAAGIECVPRVSGAREGLPELEDGRVLEAANVVWCTGYRPDFSWIDLPAFGGAREPNEPVHDKGVVPSVPGLYFVGLFFLYAVTSSLLRGVGRDAKRIAEVIARG